MLSKHVDWDVLVEKVTVNPRQLLGLPISSIDPDQPANLTLFNPEKTWVLDEKTNLSKSRNSPWFGKELKGKTAAVFNNGKFWMDNQ